MEYGNKKYPGAAYTNSGANKGTMSRKASTGALTRNQSIVLDALKAARQPMKAYDLLPLVEGKGVKAPMTIYRALDALIDRGLVYKLKASKTYIAYQTTGSHIPVFLVCENCGQTTLVTDPDVERAARNLVAETEFTADRMRVEITSRCCGS